VCGGITAARFQWFIKSYSSVEGCDIFVLFDVIRLLVAVSNKESDQTAGL
jgi:hypothetical protein